ncbi:hypothetical protein Pelo_9395 [Pelomyxa schiedti]|nr:hypothetical protein Pelo_9395 [Pelomyxa schiedti]
MMRTTAAVVVVLCLLGVSLGQSSSSSSIILDSPSGGDVSSAESSGGASSTTSTGSSTTGSVTSSAGSVTSSGGDVSSAASSGGASSATSTASSTAGSVTSSGAGGSSGAESPSSPAGSSMTGSSPAGSGSAMYQITHHYAKQGYGDETCISDDYRLWVEVAYVTECSPEPCASDMMDYNNNILVECQTDEPFQTWFTNPYTVVKYGDDDTCKTVVSTVYYNPSCWKSPSYNSYFYHCDATGLWEQQCQYAWDEITCDSCDYTSYGTGLITGEASTCMFSGEELIYFSVDCGSTGWDVLEVFADSEYTDASPVAVKTSPSENCHDEPAPFYDSSETYTWYLCFDSAPEGEDFYANPISLTMFAENTCETQTDSYFFDSNCNSISGGSTFWQCSADVLTEKTCSSENCVPAFWCAEEGNMVENDPTMGVNDGCYYTDSYNSWYQLVCGPSTPAYQVTVSRMNSNYPFMPGDLISVSWVHTDFCTEDYNKDWDTVTYVTCQDTEPTVADFFNGYDPLAITYWGDSSCSDDTQTMIELRSPYCVIPPKNFDSIDTLFYSCTNGRVDENDCETDCVDDCKSSTVLMGTTVDSVCWTTYDMSKYYTVDCGDAVEATTANGFWQVRSAHTDTECSTTPIFQEAFLTTETTCVAVDCEASLWDSYNKTSCVAAASFVQQPGLWMYEYDDETCLDTSLFHMTYLSGACTTYQQVSGDDFWLVVDGGTTVSVKFDCNDDCTWCGGSRSYSLDACTPYTDDSKYTTTSIKYKLVA